MPDIPDRHPDVVRAHAFQDQASVVAREVEKLWLMREWGDGTANLDLSNALATLKVLRGELTMADFVKEEAA